MEETKKVGSEVGDKTNVWTATGLGLIFGIISSGVIWKAFEGVNGVPIGLRASATIGIGLLPVLALTLIGVWVNKNHYKNRLECLFADILACAGRQRQAEPLLPKTLLDRMNETPDHPIDNASSWLGELVNAANLRAHDQAALETHTDNLRNEITGLAAAVASMTNFLVKATSDVWATRGSLRDPKPFVLEPKQATEYRRQLGVRALYLSSLLHPKISLEELTTLFSRWDDKLLTDIIIEAVARHVVDDNWPPCAELRQKLGGDYFERKIKEAVDRLEAEARRRSKSSRTRPPRTSDETAVDQSPET